VRQVVRKHCISVARKDTPSQSSDTPCITPDCRLYWIQKQSADTKEDTDNNTTDDLNDNLRNLNIGTSDNKSETSEYLFENRGEKVKKIKDTNKDISTVYDDEYFNPTNRVKMTKDDDCQQRSEDSKKLKVAGQRSKKPTLARVWRKQKERQKLENRQESC